MPAFNASGNSTTISAPEALQVVCAWPVSGQYGPGSRVLYYVLVAACVLARKEEWLRKACLAAALLFPAVAAFHGLVLASLHVNGAVDMDIYGAFQLCSIGILAAPLTVRLSRTYFYDPGRNLIFLWTGLILAGLLAIIVEFYRANPTPCTHDDYGNPISTNAKEFPYENATCGLVCNVHGGPHSSMRGGSANNIYVIPTPQKLSFNTALLLAAACCIPAILSMIFMWIKILEINWKTRFGEGDIDQPIEGTNGATVGKMRGVNEKVRLFLSVIEAPLFCAAILAILGIGETNFFSKQVRYQTEPMASIGQWAPIAGTVLAALGSLYLLMTAEGSTPTPGATSSHPIQHYECSHHHHGSEGHGSEGQPTLQVHPSVELSRSSRSINDNTSDRTSHDLHHAPTVTMPPSPSPDGHPRSATVDAGRRSMNKLLTKAGNYLGTAAHNKFDTADFKHGRAVDFPEIPGERNRNAQLPKIKKDYSDLVRVISSANSVRSFSGVEQREVVIAEGSNRVVTPIGSPRTESPGGRVRVRRDTLEVPSPALR